MWQSMNAGMQMQPPASRTSPCGGVGGSPRSTRSIAPFAIATHPRSMTPSSAIASPRRGPGGPASVRIRALVIVSRDMAAIV